MHPERKWKLQGPLLQNLPCASLHLAAPELYPFIITGNLVSTLFSWILWVMLANGWNWKGGCGKPQFIACRSGGQVTTWTCSWHLKLGGNITKLSPWPAGSNAVFRQTVSKLRSIIGHSAGVTENSWWCGGKPAPLPTTGVQVFWGEEFESREDTQFFLFNTLKGHPCFPPKFSTN